jgi:hypothetical protein
MLNLYDLEDGLLAAMAKGDMFETRICPDDSVNSGSLLSMKVVL